MGNRKITFDIGYNIDKTGLNELKASFTELKKVLPSDLVKLNIYPGDAKAQMKAAKQDFTNMQAILKQVEAAFDTAFDSTTGQTNLVKLNNSLKALNINKLSQDFAKFGQQGEKAFYQITKNALSANTQLTKTQTLIDKMGQTFVNTIKWSISSRLINSFTGAVQQAYGYVQHLDSSLNDIRIVTGKSADEMDKFAIKANDAAKALGSATTEYTEAALIYYQQGLSDEEAQARAETTLKAANVTGQTGRQVSEELTAVWNGYKVSAEETELYVDKLAAVAATTASDLEELSTGMSKVASAANNMGVDVDQLNAQLATIISVTRQAPETAGTALKTIYARMEDLKISGEDEYGVKLGDVSGTLDEVGIHILDTSGDLRDLGEVIEEVAGKWNTWTRAQQNAIAQSLAGKRQYNNLLALFDNWNMYTDALETSKNATGTLQKQQDIYMESTEAHIQQLKTEWEDLYDSILDTDDINSVIDIFTKFLDKITIFVDTIGGGKNLLLTLGSTAFSVFHKQIGQELSKVILKLKESKEVTNQLKAQMQNIELFKSSQDMQMTGVRELVNSFEQISAYYNVLDQEGIEQANVLAKQVAEAAMLKEEFERSAEAANNYANAVLNVKTYDIVSNQLKDSQLTSKINNDLENLKLLEKEFKNLSEVINNFSTYTQKDLNKTFSVSNWKEFIRHMNKIQSEIDKGNVKFKNLSQQIKDFLKLKNGLWEVSKRFNEIGDAAFGGSEKAQKLKDAVKKINESLRGGKSTSIDTFNSGIKILEEGLKTATPEARAFLEELLRLKEQAPAVASSFDQAKINLDQFLETARIKALTQSFTQLIGKTGQLVSSISTLKNGLEAINDSSLTGFEKFERVITSIGFGLPLFISSVSTLAATIPELTAAFTASTSAIILHSVGLEYDEKLTEKQNLAMAAEYLGLQMGTTAWGRNTSAIWENVAAMIGLDVAAAPVLATITLITIALAALTTGIIIAVKKYNDHIEALHREADAQSQLSNELHETTEAMNEQANQAMELYDKYNDLSQSSADYRDQLRDLLIQYGYLTKANQVLTGTYEDLDEMMKQIVIDANVGIIDSANAELLQTKSAIKSSIWAGGKDDEETAFDMVNGQQSIDIGGQGVEDIRDILDKYHINVLDDWGHISLDDFVNALVENYDALFGDLQRSSAGSAKALVEYINKYVDSGVRDKVSTSKSNRDTALEKNVQLGTDWASKITDSDSYEQAVIDYATQLSGQTEGEEFDKAVVKAQQYLATVSDLAVTFGSYQQQIEDSGIKIVDSTEQSFKKIFSSEDLDDLFAIKDKIQEAIDNNYGGDVEAFFSDLSQGAAVGFDNLTEEFETGAQLIDKYGQDYFALFGEEFDWRAIFNLDGSAMSDDVIAVTQETLDTVYGTLSKFDPTGKYTSAIDEETWLKFIGLAQDGDNEGLAESINKYIEAQIEEAKINFNSNAGVLADNMQSIINDSLAGDLDTGEGSVYSGIITDLETMKDLYPDLSDEINIFTNEGLIGTEKWTQAAYDLKDVLNNFELQNLNDTFNEQLQDIKDLVVQPEIDDTEFKNEMDDLIDADYSISVKIYSDGIDEFENAETALDNIDDMASKIGEDFIVAADDIRELNNAFPGILEGMTYLADGTVQLNQEVAQSAMDMATQEETASTEATVTKLQNSAAELRAKADLYDQMAQLAFDAAEDTTKADEAAYKISSKLTELDSENDKIATDTEIENSHLVVNDSATNAPILAENWKTSYQEAATAANDWADVALAASKAVTEDEESYKVDVSKKDFGVNFTGKNATSSEKATSAKVKDYDSNTDAATWKELGEDLANTATAYRSQANDLEGAAAELAAKTINSIKTNSETGLSTSDDSSSESSSSEDEAETEEYLEREEDLYKQINEQLEDVESTLSRIQTIDEHSWGVNSKKALEEENELLKTQMELYEQKSETQKSELADKKAELEAQGITFSEDGSVMTNTEETLDELYEEYNAMVDVYNAMTASEQETYKETLEAKQDTIDEIEEAIDDYESAYNDYNDTLDELLDTHYAIIENEVKQFTAEVEVHLELAEARNEWVDFWYDVVEDVEDTDFGKLIAKSMEKLDTYIGQEGTILALTNEADIGIDEVQKQIANAASAGGDSIFGDDSALSKETLETIRDNLIDAVTSAKEEIDNIKESILDAYDDMGDKIEEQAEGWKTVGDQLEHNLEVIKLIDGESAYGELNNQYEQIKQNDLELADWWSKQVTRYSTDIQKYQNLLNATASTDPMYRVYSDLLDKATEKYKDAVSNVNETIESSIKHLQDLRDNTVNQALDKLDKSLSNNMGLDSMKDQWDLAIEKQDYFLDNVERSLAMDEIEDEFKTIFEGIDTTSSKYQDLLKFQDEEIAKLNQKNKLTQYDIDELKARLELKKQELALEEAQKNKSNLRLRRDSQGNYTYQYTADQDAADEAEKNLLTARRDWYELVKQRNEDVTEEVYDIRKRLVEKTEELHQAEADKDEARVEYLKKEIKELSDYEVELTQEGQKARQDFYKGTADFFADVDNNSILPMWDTTMSNMIDDWNDGTEASFVGAVQTGINEIDAAHAQYAQDVETLMTAAGRTMEDYRNDGVDPTTESLQELQESNDEVNESLDETETLIEELTTELDKAMDAYESLEDTAVKSIEKINETLKTLSETVIIAVDNAKDLEEAYENAAAAGEKAATASSDSSSSGTGENSGTTTTGSDNTKTTKISSNNQKYVVGAAQGGDPNEWGVYAVTNNGNRKQFVENGTATWIKKKYGDIFTFKTYKSGGYTGSWNNGSDENNGKLAFLHQKELVLNEADTTNILNAVDSVRDLVKGNSNDYVSQALANSLANTMSLQTSIMAGISSRMLQAIASSVTNNDTQNYRNMTVNADFSGVRSAEAIYQAIMELENYASQVSYSNSPEANRRY